MNEVDTSGETVDVDETPLPSDALIILPIRNTVTFPGMIMPLAIGRPESIAAAQEAARRGVQLGVVLQRDPAVDHPEGKDLHPMGTTCDLLRYVTSVDGSHHVVCRGTSRFRVKEFLSGYPFLVARIDSITDTVVKSPELEARLLLLKQQGAEALALMPQASDELAATFSSIDDASTMVDFMAGILDIPPADKQELLECVDLMERMDRVLARLAERLEVLKISRRIGEKTQASVASKQREHLLREQLHQIREELGETDESSEEIAALREAIAAADMPAEVEEVANKELKRLERLPEGMGERSMVRTYLDWLIDIPWSSMSGKDVDIVEARRILDEEHFGLQKIKSRILEYLAVRKLNPEGRSPILCFVGPPGVGKTSLGQSIAHATGRAFVRASLGGVHDEAEIRGHRRTYMGALPGNIVQSIRKAGAMDPVFMLDEMDKLGSGFHGDPSSALLEVLDPEQNTDFRDNYLAVPMDLSKVLFIATANVLDNIPGPLRDRMEVVELPSYTEDEKFEIANRYLVKRQLEANGLTAENCQFTEPALRAIISQYTREAGCRSLERQIGAVCRGVAMRVAEGKVTGVRVDAADLSSWLGAPRFESEVAMRTSVSGVATGLAWTPVGGDILFVEANRVPGTGRLILTGQLGDVMKESAQAALTLVKGNAESLGVRPEQFEKSDVHLHVPAGAIPKDGPSAGVAMYVALVSLLSERVVRSDTAMTGEVSLRGLVLPVGGVKEKVLAAARAGITTVLLPARNRKDIEDIPEAIQSRLKFVWLEHVDEAIAAALDYKQAEPTPGESAEVATDVSDEPASTESTEVPG